MAESSIFGSGLDSNQADYSPGGPDVSSFGGGPNVSGGVVDNGTDVLPPNAAPTEGQGLFGSGVTSTFTPPRYTSDPMAAPLDAASNLLQQRIQRANQISSNPIAALLDPEGVAKARAFVAQGAEAFQKIEQQKAAIQAGKVQAQTLGLAPGEVSDQATAADRLEVASAKALKGDLNAFKGIAAIDKTRAENLAPQVYEAVAGHLDKAQFAFDKLSNMTSQGEYSAAVSQLRRDGTLADLEQLGLKVPPTFEAFAASKGKEGQALREARIGINDVRNRLEERNTYQPMEKKEAETYANSFKTVYGDVIGSGTPSRNASSGARGTTLDTYDDPRKLGRGAVLATPEQRKEIRETIEAAVPKQELEKYRAENRTYKLATTDGKGNYIGDGKINTNPNVQQGIAEGLASMLRGGSGGANVGLLNIEKSKIGYIQSLVDKITTEKASVINDLKGKDVLPYLSGLRQEQMRDVLDALKQYNNVSIGDRLTSPGGVAERAGALGLGASDLGLGPDEVGGVGDAIERGRQAQIALDLTRHQAIGGGRGVLTLGAQRPGADATALPQGTQPRTQQPGGDRVATPVQQATQPPGTRPPPVGPAQSGPPPSSAPPAAPGPGGGGPQTIAGQSVNVPPVPGVSPQYVQRMQAIETRNERDPWIAGAKGSSATGAYQFISGTWKQYKPPGAPDRAADATPQQQTEAMAKFTADNVKALHGAGVPVNDTSVYMAHNVGAGPAAALLKADPKADARSIVGEKAAVNNPLFYKGRPSVATVLARYQAEMNGSLDDTGPKPKPGAGGATAEAPSLMQRVSRLFSQGVPEENRDKAVADVGNAAVEHAPAIGSTIGAVGGSAAGPVGTVAGGAAGGAVGQSLKDYIQGNDQSALRIGKEAALGGVLGVGGAARPLLGAAARAGGAGAVEAGAKAIEGGDTADVLEAGAGGVAAAAGGEAFGRALGMGLHKTWQYLAPSAQKSVQTAAGELAEARRVLETEQPKMPGAAGGAPVDNPAYKAAEEKAAKAEAKIKDVLPHANMDEVAYAHEVTSKDLPPSKQEAQVGKPGAAAEADIGRGYKQLESEVADKGVGNVKPTPKLADGPIAAAAKMSPDLQRAAERTELAITAPAPDWKAKWVQLKDARSALLDLERDALSSTTAGRTQLAKDYRTLADAVRVQQEKAAKYVFGEKDGEAFMGRLKTLDVRYRNLMEATNGGDLAGAAALKGEAGREAQRKFEAFAMGDKEAIEAFRAMRKAGGDPEKTVPWTVVLEGIPVVKHLKIGVMANMLRNAAREQAAGAPVKFKDLIHTQLGTANQSTRDLLGTAAQRGATMQ